MTHWDRHSYRLVEWLHNITLIMLSGMFTLLGIVLLVHNSAIPFWMLMYLPVLLLLIAAGGLHAPR